MQGKKGGGEGACLIGTACRRRPACLAHAAPPGPPGWPSSKLMRGQP